MRFNTFALLLSLSFLLFVGVGCASKPHADFGTPVEQIHPRVQAEVVLANPSQYIGQSLTIEGEITEVCASKGCWLKFGDADAEQQIFVKFTCPIGGRLIPMEAVGHMVTVEGELTGEMVPEDEARHYAEDSGKSPEEIAKIVGEQYRLRMKAPGARVWGIEPPAAQPTSRPSS